MPPLLGGTWLIARLRSSVGVVVRTECATGVAGRPEREMYVRRRLGVADAAVRGGQRRCLDAQKIDRKGELGRTARRLDAAHVVRAEVTERRRREKAFGCDSALGELVRHDAAVHGVRPFAAPGVREKGEGKGQCRPGTSRVIQAENLPLNV